MFRMRFTDGGELVLTEAGKKKRAGVWLVTAEQLDADLAHLGPDALELDATTLARDPRQRASATASAPSRPAGDRRNRAGARERDPPARAALTVQVIDRALGRGGRATRNGDRRRSRARARAPRAGKGRLGRLPRPRPPRRAVPAVRDADRSRGLRGAHDLLLPAVPDWRAAAEGSPALPAPSVTFGDERLRSWRPLVALEAATLVSATGNGVALVALPWVVLDLTGSAADVGLVAAVSAVPLVLSAFVAGTIVDLFGRRRTAVVSDVLSGISIAAIPMAAWLTRCRSGFSCCSQPSAPRSTRRVSPRARRCFLPRPIRLGSDASASTASTRRCSASRSSSALRSAASSSPSSVRRQRCGRPRVGSPWLLSPRLSCGFHASSDHTKAALDRSGATASTGWRSSGAIPRFVP